jgi:hypothetical protein
VKLTWRRGRRSFGAWAGKTSRSCSRARQRLRRQGALGRPRSSGRRRRWSPARCWPRPAPRPSPSPAPCSGDGHGLHVVGRGDAVRDPELGRGGGRRGPRPARLRAMTGGTVVVLGPVGRASRRHDRRACVPVGSVGPPRRGAPRAVRRAVRLAEAVAVRDDGKTLAADLRRLLGAHRGADPRSRRASTAATPSGRHLARRAVPAAPAVVAAPARARRRSRRPPSTPTAADAQRAATGPSPSGVVGHHPIAG